PRSSVTSASASSGPDGIDGRRGSFNETSSRGRSSVTATITASRLSATIEVGRCDTCLSFSRIVTDEVRGSEPGSEPFLLGPGVTVGVRALLLSPGEASPNRARTPRSPGPRKRLRPRTGPDPPPVRTGAPGSALRLLQHLAQRGPVDLVRARLRQRIDEVDLDQIGRASCRERGWVSGGAAALNKQGS